MQSAYDTLWDGHEQARSAIERERDSNKHQLEEVVRVLKERGLYEEIVREANGGVVPVKMLNLVFGDQGPTLLDEY